MPKFLPGNIAIISAVERLLNRGDRDLTITKICRESKYSRSGFYHHFGSIDQCLIEAFNIAVSELDKALSPWMLSKDPESPKLLHALRASQDCYLKHGNLMVLMRQRQPEVFYQKMRGLRTEISKRIQIMAPWIPASESDLITDFLHFAAVAMWEEFVVTNVSECTEEEMFDIIYHSWTLMLHVNVWSEKLIEPKRQKPRQI
tara:strand:+ start:81 stop:686 length:606 start_codon:yes stop_codon:yes gene_type:complete